MTTFCVDAGSHDAPEWVSDFRRAPRWVGAISSSLNLSPGELTLTRPWGADRARGSDFANRSCPTRHAQPGSLR